MAKIYALESGEIIRLIETDEQMTMSGEPPGFVSLLEFDPETNPDLTERIKTRWNLMRLLGTQLTDGEQIITINLPGNEWIANANIKTGYPALPDWVRTATAADVSNYVTNNVWQGLDKTQANAWIDANVTGNNVAALRTSVVAAFKLVAGAIIDLRDLMAIEAKLIIYLRDLILRFRK